MADEELFLQELLAFIEHDDAQHAVQVAADMETLLHSDISASISSSDTAQQAQSLASKSSYSSSSDSCSRRHANNATPSAAPRAKASRNSSRDRLQSELRQLRAQRLELEHALAALHAKRQSAQAALSQSELLLLATWEHIAKRQLAQRERAEAENARLKDKVARSRALAQALEQSLQHWVHELAPFGSSGSEPSDLRIALQSTPFADPRDVAIYTSLAGDLDAVAEHLDAVFQANGLGAWHIGAPPSSVQLQTRPSGAVYLEFLSADVFPFAPDVVFRASRRVYEQRSLARSCVVYDAMAHAPEVFAAKSRCEILAGGDRVSLEYLSITRALERSDCCVYVWRGLTKSDAQFPGAYVDETGYQVVRALDDAGAACVVLTCTQLEPRERPSSSSTRPATPPKSVAPLANFVLSAFRVDMQEVNDMMMNVLLQDPTGGGGSTGDEGASEVHV